MRDFKIFFFIVFIFIVTIIFKIKFRCFVREKLWVFRPTKIKEASPRKKSRTVLVLLPMLGLICFD